MAEIVCGTCGTNDGTHERWCAVGRRITEIAAKDRRIAELEAALGNEKETRVKYQDIVYAVCVRLEQMGAPRPLLITEVTSALDALLAQAKREAIDRCIAIAKGCEDYGGGYREQDLEIYHHGMQTVHRCLMQLRDGDESLQLRMVESIGRRMAREVKP